METARCIWSSKLNIFKIVHPFRKFGSWQSYTFVQMKGNFQTGCSQEAQKFWLSGYTNYVTSLAIPTTCKCTWGMVDIAWCSSWQQPMYGDRTDEENRTQSQIICGQFFFPPLNFWWLDNEKMKLWNCWGKQEGHARWPKCKTVKLRWGHSCEDRRRLDINTGDGQRKESNLFCVM